MAIAYLEGIMMKNLLLGLTLTILLVGCGSTEQSQKPKEVDPRQGEKVSQVCFTGDMDGWSTLESDNKALIVYGRRNAPHKLTLIGTCDPEWAMLRIGTIKRHGSNCLSRGDQVVTDAGLNMHDRCTITQIHKWHPEKLPTSDDEKSDDKQSSSSTEEN